MLFVHDSTKANVWLIDFGKTVPVPNSSIKIDHKSPWEVGNHEDGYLIGVQNLINIFSDVAAELRTSTSTPENQRARKSSHHDNRSTVVEEKGTPSNTMLDNVKNIGESSVSSNEPAREPSRIENNINITESNKLS